MHSEDAFCVYACGFSWYMDKNYCSSSFSVPTGPPLNFNGVFTNPTILTLSWEDPEESMRNGVIIGYAYMCEGVHSEPQVTQEMTAVVTGLMENQQYTCRVGATTINGTGPFASLIQRTAEDDISGRLFFSSICCMPVYVCMCIHCY